MREDLVRRRFTAEEPNRLWLTDLTEHPTAEGRLYVCAIKDAWSNQIVGYSIDERMTSRLVVRAVESGVARRGEMSPGAGCIPTGEQTRWRERCRGTVCMGRWAGWGLTPRWTAFSPLLQNNVLNRRRWDSRQQLRTAIVSWIERTHHRRRRQVRLDRLTPVEFETIMSPAAGLAA